MLSKLIRLLGAVLLFVVTPAGAQTVPSWLVKDRSLSAPPGSPTTGDRYIIGASPTGLWAGHANAIASWNGAAWKFISPQTGLGAWIEDEPPYLAYFDGSAWNLQRQVYLRAVEDCGLKESGNGTDNAAALNACVQKLPAKGGAIFVSAGNYSIGSTIILDRGVRLLCESAGDYGSATGIPASPATILKWTGGASVMVNIKSATVDQWIFEGAIDNCVFNGLNGGVSTATGCVALHSGVKWFFDFRCTGITTEGFRIDGSNHSGAGNFGSQFNYVRRYHYVRGADAAGDNSVGLIIDGTTEPIGHSTQTIADWVKTTTKNGAGVIIKGTDNNHINILHGNVDGTGYTLDFRNGIDSGHPARLNHIGYLVGQAHAESDTFGNRILSGSSETGGIHLDAGAQLSYTVNDNAKGGMYSSRVFKLTDTARCGGNAFRGSTAATTYSFTQGLWGWITLLEGQTATVGCTFPPDPEWNIGTLTSVKIMYVVQGAGGGNVELRLQMSTATDINAQTINETDETITVPAGTAGAIDSAVWTPASPLAFAAGDYTLFRITRTSANPADTSTRDASIVGVEINFQSTKPIGDIPYEAPPGEHP